jgi:uncharacterized protein YwgA
MAEIQRSSLMLLLIGLTERGDADGYVSGITRLQKFLYLLQEEAGIAPSKNGFEFEPYKAGPYSPRVYDDLELLENLGFVESMGTTESTETEAADLDKLVFDDLMEAGSKAADAFEERRFTLTEKGQQKVRDMLDEGSIAPVADGIRKVKSKFSSLSLRELLRYVYEKHPEMTTESEIIDQVLGRRSRR